MPRLTLVIGTLLILVRGVSGQTKKQDPPPVVGDSHSVLSQDASSLPPPLPQDKTPKKVDKEKLRELARVPSVHWQFTLPLKLSPLSEKIKNMNSTERNKRICNLEKELSGNAKDADIYLKLGSLYEDEEKQKEAYAQAAVLFRERIQVDPKNGWLRARYARTLDNNLQAEEQALEGVRLAPENWRCWEALGAVYARQFYGPLQKALQHGGIRIAEPSQGILGDLLQKPRQALKQESEEHDASQDSGNEESWFLERPSELSCAEIQTMTTNLQKAWRCYDKMAVLAPEDPDVYWSRIEFQGNCWSGAMLHDDAGQAFVANFTAYVEDYRKLARLRPNDPDIQARFASVICLAALSQGLAPISKDGNREGDEINRRNWKRALSPENRIEVYKVVAKLEKLANGKDRTVAESSLRHLATLLPVLGEWKKGERYARRGIAIQPDNADFWNCLLGSLREQKRGDDYIRVCRDMLTHIPTGEVHFQVAFCRVAQEKFHAAEKVLREGLKKEPQHIPCNVALAAVLIRCSKKADTLAEADALLDRATKGIEESKDKEAVQHYYRDAVFNRGIIAGLRGDVAASWIYFNALPDDDGDAKKARSLFSN
jgi:Tfp pilus assembly protein PilF